MKNKTLKTLLLCGVSCYATSLSFGFPHTEVKMKTETPLFLETANMPSFSQMVKDLSAKRMGIQGLLGQKIMGDVLAFDDEKEDQAWPIIDACLACLTLWVMQGNRLYSDYAKNTVKNAVALLNKIDPEFIDVLYYHFEPLVTICKLRQRIVNEESTEILVKYVHMVRDYFVDQELGRYEQAYWKYFLLFDRPGKKSIFSLARENPEVLNAIVRVFDGIIEGDRTCTIENGDPLEDILTINVDGDPLWLFFYSHAPETLLKLLKKAVPSSPIHSWGVKRPDGSTIRLKDLQKQSSNND